MDIIELVGSFEKKDGVLGCLEYFDGGGGRGESACKEAKAASVGIECHWMRPAKDRDAQRRMVLGFRVRQNSEWRPVEVAGGRERVHPLFRWSETSRVIT